MYPVSQEFHEKITAPERRVLGKVEITYTPTLTETYTGDDLFYIRLLEEREDVDSGSIPVGNISANEIDIRLDNSERKFDPGNTNSPLYGLMKKGLKVRAWLGAELDSGDKEWVPLGVFYTISWDAPESDLYCHVTARDRLDQLRETDYTTSKAIVAPAALPKPVFTRASTAYKEDGTQVAANVPRFVPDNLALGKPVTTNGEINKGTLSMVTDGCLVSSAHLDIRGDDSPKYVVVDLGTVKAISEIRVWHYHADGRIYKNTKTEVSKDGVAWEVVFDSATKGTYKETATGHRISFDTKEVRYVRDWVNGSDKNNSNHWVEIQALSPFKEGILIEEGTTNLLTAESASFEGGTRGDWNGNGATLSIVSNGWHGSKGLKVVSSTTSGRAQIDITSKVAVGDIISLTAWARLESGSPRTVSMAITVGGVSTQAESKTIYSDRWTKISVTHTLTTLGNGVYIQLFGGQYQVRTDTAIWDGVQLEKGPPTSFTPTTRKAETLTVPAAGVLDNSEGTIDITIDVTDEMRMKSYSQATTFRYIFTHATEKEGAVISNVMGLSYYIHYDDEKAWSFWAGSTFLDAPDDLPEGKHRFTLRWVPMDGSRIMMSLSIDGELKAEGVELSAFPTFFNDTCWIGSDWKGSWQANTYIDEVRFSSTFRSDEEVAAYGDPNTPLPVDDKTTLYMGMDGDFTVQPTGIQLYALAKGILQDAGLTEDEYYIDPKLRDILVPASYFEPQSHREALRKVAEAGLAVVYCDRENGKIRVEIPEAPAVEEIEEVFYIQGASFPAEMTAADVYGISADDYFQKTNPEAKLANQIAVVSQPLTVGDLEQVYESAEPVRLEIDEEKTVTVFYDKEPCINAQVNSSADTTITGVRQYTWGANIKLKNTSWPFDPQTINAVITVKARPLEVKGKQKITARDEASIAENGLMSYDFPDNPLVQSREVAQLIADNLLQVYAPARRDVELDWRGNPALELGDVVCVPDYQRDGIDTRGYYVVVQQEFEWDGGLRAKLVGVKVPDAE